MATTSPMLPPEWEPYLDAWRSRRSEEAAARARRARRARRRLPEAVARLREAGASRVILFGSLSRGGLDTDSDIDLAVDGLSLAACDEAERELSGLFGRPVQVVRLSRAPAAFRRLVKGHGEVLS